MNCLIFSELNRDTRGSLSLEYADISGLGCMKLKCNENESAYPAFAGIFFHIFAVVVVVEGGVSFHSFLLAEVVVLSFGAVNSGVSNLSRGENCVKKGPGTTAKNAKLDVKHVSDGKITRESKVCLTLRLNNVLE